MYRPLDLNIVLHYDPDTLGDWLDLVFRVGVKCDRLEDGGVIHRYWMHIWTRFNSTWPKDKITALPGSVQG